MKTQKLKKIVLTGLTAGLAIIAASAYAQFHDSSIGTNALRGNPVIQQKYLPAQPTPIVNNVTNVTQVVQPNVTTASGSSYGYRFATAWANCGGGQTLLGGGGSCSADNGYAAMPTSQPNGNSWQVICDAFQGGNVAASAWSTCSY